MISSSIYWSIRGFDYSPDGRYNPPAKFVLVCQEVFVEVYLDIGLIITSIALIASVILQSKGAGLGGLTGADTGGIFTARRGIEKTLFRVTIGLSVLFFILAISTVIVVG
jgi:preprotein translocase subunit SecG